MFATIMWVKDNVALPVDIERDHPCFVQFERCTQDTGYFGGSIFLIGVVNIYLLIEFRA